MPKAPDAAPVPKAGFACPICGKDTPHTHGTAEVEQWRETELWVERSWQDMRQMMDAALAGDFKPPLKCGCDDDPECPFCGHPKMGDVL